MLLKKCSKYRCVLFHMYFETYVNGAFMCQTSQNVVHPAVAGLTPFCSFSLNCIRLRKPYPIIRVTAVHTHYLKSKLPCKQSRHHSAIKTLPYRALANVRSASWLLYRRHNIFTKILQCRKKLSVTTCFFFILKTFDNFSIYAVV